MKRVNKKEKDGFHKEFPDKFIFTHNYCSEIVDLLISLLRAAEKRRLFNIQFDISNHEHYEKLSAEGIDFIDTMYRKFPF